MTWLLPTVVPTFLHSTTRIVGEQSEKAKQDRRLLKNKRYYARNRSRVKIVAKAYREKNRETLNEKARERRRLEREARGGKPRWMVEGLESMTPEARKERARKAGLARAAKLTPEQRRAMMDAINPRKKK